MQEWIHNYLSPEELEKIKNEIEKVEQSTSGQIRLSVREKRRFWEKLYKPHELAVKDFEKLGIANTKNKTGVLIFIIFNEKYYDILADEGINTKINDHIWLSIEEKIKEEFPNEGYSNGILHVIDRVGEILAKEFPHKAEDTDELPDEVVVQ
jgi:uncharacterized membrane protein